MTDYRQGAGLGLLEVTAAGAVRELLDGGRSRAALLALRMVWSAARGAGAAELSLVFV